MAKKVSVKIEKKNKGYYFPQLDIHVVADSEKDAKNKIKSYYGFDVDEAVKQMEAAKAAAEK